MPAAGGVAGPSKELIVEELARASSEPLRELTIHANGWLNVPEMADWGPDKVPPVPMTEELREVLTTLQKEFRRVGQVSTPGPDGAAGAVPRSAGPWRHGQSCDSDGQRDCVRGSGGALSGPWLQLQAPERGCWSSGDCKVPSGEYPGQSAQGST